MCSRRPSFLNIFNILSIPKTPFSGLISQFYFNCNEVCEVLINFAVQKKTTKPNDSTKNSRRSA